MKKFIKALYWAYFPEERQREIDTLKSNLRHIENMLLVSQGMAEGELKFITPENVYKTASAIRELRKSENDLRMSIESLTNSLRDKRALFVK